MLRSLVGSEMCIRDRRTTCARQRDRLAGHDAIRQALSSPGQPYCQPSLPGFPCVFDQRLARYLTGNRPFSSLLELGAREDVSACRTLNSATTLVVRNRRRAFRTVLFCRSRSTNIRRRKKSQALYDGSRPDTSPMTSLRMRHGASLNNRLRCYRTDS